MPYLYQGCALLGWIPGMIIDFYQRSFGCLPVGLRRPPVLEHLFTDNGNNSDWVLIWSCWAVRWRTFFFLSEKLAVITGWSVFENVRSTTQQRASAVRMTENESYHQQNTAQLALKNPNYPSNLHFPREQKQVKVSQWLQKFNTIYNTTTLANCEVVQEG